MTKPLLIEAPNILWLRSNGLSVQMGTHFSGTGKYTASEAFCYYENMSIIREVITVKESILLFFPQVSNFAQTYKTIQQKKVPINILYSIKSHLILATITKQYCSKRSINEKGEGTLICIENFRIWNNLKWYRLRTDNMTRHANTDRIRNYRST